MIDMLHSKLRMEPEALACINCVILTINNKYITAFTAV